MRWTQEDQYRSLERAKSILLEKAKDEQVLKDKANNSLLPYPLFCLANLGVAGGMPPYTSIIILLHIGLFITPETFWSFMGLNGKELVLNSPEFIQYYVLNSSFPNSMYIFWFLSPYILMINSIAFFHHTHIKTYDAYLARRKLLLSEKRSFSLSIQMILFIGLYLWMVFSNLAPPSSLGNFVPLKNKLSMLFFHGAQISLILPLFITLITAELRAELSSLNKSNKNI